MNKQTQAAAQAASSTDLQTLLGDGLARRWWQSITLWLGLLAVAAVAGGWWYWQSSQQAQAAPRYVTQEVQRGQVKLTVAANGTLQPTRSVEVMVAAAVMPGRRLRSALSTSR